MKGEITEKFFRHMVSQIIKDADIAVDDNKKNNCEFNAGRKLAYYEVLDTINNRLAVYNRDEKDYGYDADWEQKLMF